MRALRTRRGCIYLALSLLTGSWVAWVLWALFGDAGPPLPVTLVVLVVLVTIPLGLARFLRGLSLRRELRRGILAGAFVFFALLVVSSGFYNDYGLSGVGWLGRLVQDDLSSGTFTNQATSLVVAASCWWLGLVLEDLPLRSANLTRYFYVCLLILAVSSISSTLFAHDTFRDAPWLFFVLAFAALVTLGLGRVEEAARRSDAWGSPFTAYWLGHLSVAAGIVLGLVGAAQALKLAYGFSLLLVMIAPVVALLAFPAVFVGAKALALVFTLAAEGQTPPEDPDLGVAGSGVTGAYDPSAAQQFCVGLVVLVVLVGILIVIAYSLRRWHRISGVYEREEAAAVPALGERVSQAVEERLERLRFRLPGVGRLRRRLAARSIRRIYAALLALGAERGYPRPAARTPYQHLRVLQQAFPGCETQVGQITEAYVAAHYGEVPETHAALDAIKAAWEQVRETARHTLPVRTQVAEKSSRA